MSEKRILGVDVPVRLFHWLYALLFVFAFTVANVYDDDAPEYIYHVLAGVAMAGLVFYRIVWGLVGSKNARFSSYNFSLKAIVQYLKNVFTGKKNDDSIHNPATSLVALGMFGVTLGLLVTGILMGQGIWEDLVEEIHEILAFTFLFLAIAHIVGVAFHQFKYRDGLIFSMLDGKKTIHAASGLQHSHRIGGVVFVLYCVVLLGFIRSNFDPVNSSLNLYVTQIQFGELEGMEDEHGEHDDDEEGEYGEDDE